MICNSEGREIKYRMFSHDVTAAMLVSQNKEMAVMLVSQTKPLGMQILSFVSLKRIWPVVTRIKTLYSLAF